MNPNAAEPLSWDTDDHGSWTAYLGWNGLALFVMAETGGSALILNDADQGLLNTAVLGPTPDGWTDVGCWLETLDFGRGASEDGGILTRYEAGVAQLSFDNTDFVLDPVATGLNINLGTTIVVLGRERDTIETLVASDPTENPWDWVFGLFKGTIDDWQAFGYEDARKVQWTVVDDVARLQNVNRFEVSPVGAGDTTEERLNRQLAVANWSTQTGSFGGAIRDTVVFPLPGAANPTHQATTLAQPVWEMMLRAADAGQRSVFVSGTGRIVATPIVPTLQLAWETWSWGCDEGQIPITTVDLDYGKTQLVNTVDAARVGGMEITVTDQASVSRHGEYSTGRNDLTLEDDVDVATWAGTVVQWSSEPAPRVTRMGVAPHTWSDEDLDVDFLQERYQLVDLSGPHSVAMVVGNSASLTAGDTVIQGLLEAMFDTVTVFDDSTAEGGIDAGIYDALVICDSVTAATVGTKWDDFASPVVILEHELWDDHLLLDNAATTFPGTTSFYVDSPPPSWLSLSAGLYNFEADGSSLTATAGTDTDLPAAAEIIARVDSDTSSFIGCWTFADGDARSGGSPAPAARVALTGNAAILADPSAAWTTLFSDVMALVVPSTFSQEIVSTPASSNAWQALLEFSDWVGSSWAGEETGLRHTIDVPIPGTSKRITDTVAIRGLQWRLDDSSVEIDFVTSTIRQFLDTFILNDAVQGILDAGHRVS